MSFYRDQLEIFLKGLDIKAGVVLDVGGAQKPVRGRTRSWKVSNYRILDLPNCNLDDQYAIGFAEQPKADVVFCLEVFEYLINPPIAFTNLCYIMKPGGRAYVSFPLIYPVHNEIELDSLRYTETGIRRLAKLVELKVDKVHYRITKNVNRPPHQSMLLHYYVLDGMKAAKGIDHEVTGYIVELVK